MWVEGGDIHDELLDQLGGVLAPPADLELTPSAAELEALVAAVAARWPGGASAPASESQAAPVPAGRRPWRRVGSSAWRAGSVAAGLVLFSASAAAAAGGVPLPRPVRVVAYSVGLPVASPALDDTNHHIKELKDAVKAQDKPKAQASARRLQTDLTKVPSDEKHEAEQKVNPVLAQAANAGLIESPTPTTTAPPPVESSTTVTSSAPTTTDTTAEKEKGNEKERPAGAGTTTTTDPPTSTTTTTAPAETTTTTGPSDPGSGGSPSGDPGTGSGDPSAGGAGGGGGGTGTTPTTAPPDTTTTTTAPGSSGGDPVTTTTTEPPTTTTTTAPGDGSIQTQQTPPTEPTQ